MKRLLLVLALMTAASAGVLVLGSGRSEPDASAAPSASFSPSVPIGRPVAFSGPAYDPQHLRSPTRSVVQHKLWHREGRWWSLLVEPSSRELRVHALDPVARGWVDTGLVVDDREDALADTVVAGDSVFIASAEDGTGARHATRLTRLDFDAARGSWQPGPDFPISITPAGVRTHAIDRHPDGQLWLAGIAEDRIFVAHSTRDAWTWTPPFLPGQAAGSMRVTNVAMAMTRDAAVVAWTSPDVPGIHLARHATGAPDDEWSDSRMDVRGVRGFSGDLAMRAVRGTAGDRLLITTGTELEASANEDAPLVLLVSVEPDGSWRPHLLGRVGDRQSRPVLAVDDSAGRLFVITTARVASGRAIFVKDSALDPLVIPAGAGTPLLEDPSAPELDDATTTGQAVGRESGLVVLASDDVSGRYFTSIVELGAPLAGPAATVDRSLVLVDDTFEPFPAGRDLTAWETTSAGVRGVAEVAASGQERVARITSRGSGDRVRACRDIRPGPSGSISFSVNVRFDRLGRSAGGVSLRGAGDDAAVVDFDDSGAIVIYDGATKVERGSFQAGSWYRATLTADLAKRRYAVQVERPGGAVVSRANGLRWRTAALRSVDQVCVETPAGGSGLRLDFDDVDVVYEPS